MRLHSAMREVSIREATVDDAVAITRVGNETWRVAYRGQVPDTYLDSMDDAARAERWREWLTEGGRRNQRTFVAEVAAEIVGYANAGPSRDPDAAEDTGEVYAIYVLPGHWDSGVGAVLMRHALEALRPDFRAATLWVLDTNERGRRFYEKGGWSDDGTAQPIEIGGEKLTEVRYRIDL